MMRVNSGGGPYPEDELHQLFRRDHEAGPGDLVSLNLAATFVEAKPRCPLGVEGRGRKAETFFEKIGVVYSFVADFLVVGRLELDADAAVLRVYKQRDMVGRRAAADRDPVVLRGLLWVEHLQELGRCLGHLAVLDPA